MSALESMIASHPNGEAGLHPSLMYELPTPSTAVVDRRQHVRFYPSSASSLNVNGTRTFRIRIGGEEFIDPSSIRLQYTIKCDGNAAQILRPLTGPWGCWSQMFCRSNGVELDNIPNYNRFHQQYGWNHLTRAEQFGSVGVEGFHVAAQTANNDFKPQVGVLGIQPITVMHRLHLSLLNSGKLLPVKYCPLEIEGTLADAVDWLKAPANPTEALVVTTAFTISDVQIIANAFVLDEAVLHSFYSALLKNRVMSIPLMTAYQIMHPMPDNATTYSFSSVRAFSRLAQVWLTFRSTGPKATSFICPANLQGQETDDGDNALPLVSANPVVTARLSIGPKNYPDPQPVSSAAEYYYMLVNALGTQPNITRNDFEHECFTIVWDLRKNPGDSTSAVSTRSGDLLRVELGNILASQGIKECWMTLVSFGVCAIRESGVALLT
jgi:hypothetical protein